MDHTEEPIPLLNSRRAITRLVIEGIIGGPGAAPLPAELLLVYLVVLDATLHDLEISAARLGLITQVARTTTGRRLAALAKLGIVEIGPQGGWRVPNAYVRRPEVYLWVERLSGLIMRSAEELRNDFGYKAMTPPA